MPVATSIKKNLYKDSVALMRIAQSASSIDGVRHASLSMGTPANTAILADAQLLGDALSAAGPGDVMIVVNADTAKAAEVAVRSIEERLDSGVSESQAATGQPASAMVFRSIATAAAGSGPAALAQISVPGPYAAAEAMKALRRGMHVFLFSDNVPIEQERALKELARRKGLLVMGPDCGTAIIGGVPLGFANVVRAGSISLVGASGTGLQEVSCQIHALGHGVRHVIGTGGRDVQQEIGGSTLRQALRWLAGDEATRVIGIVSKTPAPDVARGVLDELASIRKPVVLLFLGADLAAHRLPSNVVGVTTLHEAAARSVALAGGRADGAVDRDVSESRAMQDEVAQLASGQRHIRGLYSGGTFCAEAQCIWGELGLRVLSNVPLDKRNRDSFAQAVTSHAAIDLGADEYTVGRPHPMIDPAARLERLARDAADPSTSAIVLDVVLGFAGHDDPAGALAPAIAQAKADCTRAGRHLAVITFVCGTEDDPQRLSRQQQQLRDAGAIVLPSSTDAARFAGGIGKHAESGARRSTPEPAR